MKQSLYTKLTMILFGSWWSVALHTLFFSYFVFFPNNLLLTTIVSLEAIYIGILILMAENRQEELREQKEQREHRKDRKYLKDDVLITEDVMKEIKLLRKHHVETNKALKEIQKSIKKLK